MSAAAAGAAKHGSRGMIVRPRLLDALEPAAGGAPPLIVVTGPAGAGKTVLVETWAAQRRGTARVRVATLDATSGRVDGLWSRVACAFGVRAEDDRPGSANALAERVLALTRRRRARALVFDDFHLADGVVARQFVTRLLAEPSAPRLVLCGRADPGLALHRMRLAGTLAEVRSSELAFTLDETRELLGGAAIALSEGAVGQLWARTEGWAAGLRLAALSLAGHADPEAFVAEFAGDDRAVVAYLIDEVLARQSDAARELLLATAVVDRVSASLANALTGRDDAADVLDALVAATRWWSRSTAAAIGFATTRCSPACCGPCSRGAGPRRSRASTGGQPSGTWSAASRATGCAIASRPATGTASRRCSPSTGSRSEPKARDRCSTTRCSAFPGAALAARPYAALVAAARCLDRGEASEAEMHLRAAVAGRARVAGARRARFVRDLALVRLQRAARDGDVATALRQQAVVDAARDDDPVRARRADALGHLELARLCVAEGDARAPLHLDAVARLAGADFDDVDLSVAADGERAWLRVLDGDLRGARVAISHAREGGADASGVAALAEALVAAEVGDVQGALTQLTAARAMLDEQPGERGRLRALEVALVEARIALLGPRAAAEAACDALRAALQGWDPAEDPAPAPKRLADLAHAELADLLVRLGRADEALALLNATPAAAAGGATAVSRMNALLALSRSDEALAAGRQVATDDGVALPCAVTASALAAGAAEAEGDRGEAQRLAEHALDLAEPDGARLGLAVALDGLDPVLRRLLRVGTAHRSLIGEVLELARAGSTVTANGIAPLHEPLSDRELTVLRYLPTLLSSSEIAGELFVTVNTVKSHLKSIYRKLEVSSRREAVARARDLGLVASAGLSVAGRPG